MIRKQLFVGGKALSYLDNERDGQVLICLHGHFGCAAMFSFLDEIHTGRLILLDQRGHGNSDRFPTYKTANYVLDLKKLIEYEKIDDPVIIGHSLGGVNAYHYAFEHQNVKALVIEDIGTEVDCSNKFIKKLPVFLNSLYEVEKSFGQQEIEFDPYFLESLRYNGMKWKFQFDYDDMVASQIEMNGNHWKQWLALTCPVLLLHGSKIWACETKNIEEMAARNSNVKLKIYEGCGHTLHDERRDQFIEDIKSFLKEKCG